MAKSKKEPTIFDGTKTGSKEGEAWTILQAVDYDAIRHLVVMAARAGGTVQLGVTRNGTAATMRIYHGGIGETFYAGDVETLEDLAHHWAQQFEDFLR